MAKRKKESLICNRDCFCCPYPDCISDAPMSEAEYREARERNDLGKTPEQRKIAAKKAAYRDAHREEIAAYQAAYRDAHREEIAAKKAAYDDAHREEIAAKKAAYYAEHREEIAAYQAAYYAEHREEIAAKKAAYRDAHREAWQGVGHELRSLRKALYMSQTELGLRFGVSQSAVSSWETGSVSFDCERVFAWLHAEISATTE